MVEEGLGAAAAGVVAGLGVAMPLGAIGALLLREGLVSGFRVAAAGAAGVASVDLVYCALATASGSLLVGGISGHRGAFLVASGLVVLAIAVRQLVHGWRQDAVGAADARGGSAAACYLRFVGLTAINPLTLVYFVALGAAVASPGGSWAVPAVFVVAVGASSLAWQVLLAGAGAVLGRGVGPRAARAASLAAALLVGGLGGCLVLTGLAALGA